MAFIYDVVETKLIVFKLKQPFFHPHRGVQGKYYTLMDLPVHGEQIELSTILVVSFSCELQLII